MRKFVHICSVEKFLNLEKCVVPPAICSACILILLGLVYNMINPSSESTKNSWKLIFRINLYNYFATNLEHKLMLLVIKKHLCSST